MTSDCIAPFGEAPAMDFGAAPCIGRRVRLDEAIDKLGDVNSAIDDIREELDKLRQ